MEACCASAFLFHFNGSPYALTRLPTERLWLCLVSILFLFRSAALYDISNILDTGLDRETLSILVGLCETGVNPEALAAVVKELQREASKAGNQ